MSATVQYVSLQDSNITGITGYASYSTDAGDNTNWIITAGGPVVSGVNYLNIQDSNATPPYWLAGDYSVNSGNNTGWLFFSNLSITESVTNANSESYDYQIYRNAVEALSVAVIENTQSDIYNGSISENSTVGDTLFVVAIFASTAVENVNLADAQTRAFIVNRDAIENTGLASVENSTGKFNSSVSENSTLANTQTCTYIVNRSALESFITASTQTPQVNYNGAVAEPVRSLDSTVARGWFAINDSQVAAWVPVDDSQNANWVDVNDNQ